MPVTTVAGRLGHAQVSTTTNIYAGFIRPPDANAADTLPAASDRIEGLNGRENGPVLRKLV